MQYEIEVEGQIRRVVVRRIGDGFAVEVDGRRFHVDAARLDPNTLSLIVGTVPSNGDTSEPAELPEPSEAGPVGLAASGGLSHEVTVIPQGVGRSMAFVGSMPFAVTLDGRRRKGGDSAHARPGPQRIAAPMPGKIVRVLVAKGDAVHARQPVVVVEAMKMENELRADRDGTVTEIHVQEGASVDAGAPLIDIR